MMRFSSDSQRKAVFANMANGPVSGINRVKFSFANSDEVTPEALAAIGAADRVVEISMEEKRNEEISSLFDDLVQSSEFSNSQRPAMFSENTDKTELSDNEIVELLDDELMRRLDLELDIYNYLAHISRSKNRVAAKWAKEKLSMFLEDEMILPEEWDSIQESNKNTKREIWEPD